VLDYDYRFEKKLKATLNQAYKKDEKLYDAVIKKDRRDNGESTPLQAVTV
jgi:hypothetical protein